MSVKGQQGHLYMATVTFEGVDYSKTFLVSAATAHYAKNKIITRLTHQPLVIKEINLEVWRGELLK